MALKAVLTKAEFETLHDVLKGEYTADGDTYILDADVEAHPKATALKSALEKERTTSKAKTANEKAYLALKDQIGDMDLEKARDAIARIQEMSDKKLIDEGQFQELLKARTEAMTKAHQAELKARDQKIDELTKSYAALDGDYTTLVLDGSIRDEAIRQGVKEEHLEDVTYRLKDRGVDGVKWRLGEGRKIVAMKDDEITYGKDGVTPMPVTEGLEVLRKNVPGFFKPSTGGGAHNSARQDGGRFVISEADAGDIGKWRAAKKAADTAGQPLEIARSS